MGLAVLSTLDANLWADGLLVPISSNSVSGNDDSLHVVFDIVNCHYFDQPITAVASYPGFMAANPKRLDAAVVSGVWRVGFLYLDNL